MDQPPSTAKLDQPPSTAKLDQPPSTAKLDKPPSTAKLDKPPSTAKLDQPPSTAPVIPADFQPFAITSWPFSDVKWSYSSTIHLALSGLSTESFSFISMSSNCILSSRAFAISPLYHSVYFLFRKALATPFTVKSNG